MTLYGRLLMLCLASIGTGALAQTQPCPPTFAGWVSVGTGSCAVPGMGTASNIRFSGTDTNGSPIPTIAEMSIITGPMRILDVDYGAVPMPGTQGIVEFWALPSLETVGSGTSTLNFAYKLTLDAGFTITGGSIIVPWGSYGVGGGAGSVGGSLSLCLNGNFTGFPPTSCSGTTQNIVFPTANFPPFQTPPADSATFSSATSIDVFVSATGSGDVTSFWPQQGFTISGQTTQPLPTISSVVNAASWIQPGLPNAGIAQGSIFVVSGSNLGPASISIASPPFQSTSLAGTSVYVTVGNQMVEAPLYYSLAGYVAALLPSNTPVGRGWVVVTYNGQAGNAFPISVVENNLGIFTITSNGQGAGIVTYPDYSLVSAAKAANCGGPGTTCGAANPGDTLILWATGLGPVNGSDTTGAGLGVNMPGVPLTLWLGGVQASVPYQGRSGCCIGEDQIVFKVPANVPTGCAVPLTVQIGNEISNSTVMPVASGSRTCTPTNPAITPSVMQALSGTAPLTIGTVGLERQVDSTSNTGYVDNGTAQFEKVTVPAGYGPFAVSYLDSEPAGTCVIYNNLSASINPPFGSVVGIDAGPSLTVSGPNGTESMNVTPGVIPTEYAGTLNSVGKFFAPGEYTITGPGGANVGSFTAQFNLITPPTWSNQTGLGTVTLADGLIVNWGGVLGNNTITIEGVSATDKTLTNGAAFSCAAPAGAGTFTVPPAVLLALPAGSYGTLSFMPATAPVGFTATGLSLGYATSNLLTEISTTFQ
ncbi:MAG: hypothetical protein WBL61_13475 [Bryobacteraceae bacterium]